MQYIRIVLLRGSVACAVEQEFQRAGLHFREIPKLPIKLEVLKIKITFNART